MPDTYYSQHKHQFKIRYEKVKEEKQTHAKNNDYYYNYYKLWCKPNLTDDERKRELKEFAEKY